MCDSFPNWITKPMIKGISSFSLDAYLLALEGWRRGLNLKWYYDFSQLTDLKVIGYNPSGKQFSLSDGKKTHFFYRSRGDLVSNEAVEIGTDKMMTKTYLVNNHVSTPQGKSFNITNSTDDIIDYVSTNMEYPVVIKPALGSLGKGVFTNISTENDIKFAVEQIRNKFGYNDVLVEEYIEGEEFRAYVVGNELVACTKKIPPHVIGDGDSTISELITQKNEIRKNNPHLSKKLIKIDDLLEKLLTDKGLSLDSILNKNEKLILNRVANTTIGAESININEGIPDDIKKQAVLALQALPCIGHAGVDMILKDHKAYVLEINPTASYLQHVFPFKGKSINVPQKIIDYYFPELSNKTNNNLVYFNYKKLNEIILNRSVDLVEVTNVEEGKVYVTRLIIEGKVQGVGYRNWARSQANKMGINGYVKNLKNGNVVIIAWSTDQNKLNNFKQLCFTGPKKSNVNKIKELEWDKQLVIGFEKR